MRIQVLIGDQLRKRKELLYNLGALSSYASIADLLLARHSNAYVQGKAKAYASSLCRVDSFFHFGHGSL